MIAAIYVSTSSAAPAPDNAIADTSKSSEEGDIVPEMAPVAESLIAAALKAGTITYEESLRQRIYALFDDPRLRPEFQGSVDGEGGLSLFLEIDRKAEGLSKELLADLVPFRARPNDPISIFNRPRKEEVGGVSGDGSVHLVSHSLTANSSSSSAWVSRLVRGTNVRIWIQGTEAALVPYEDMVGKVWRAFPGYFVHPLPDNGVQGNQYNPDSAIDIFFLPKLTFSPREPTQQLSANGQARPWPPTTDHTSSGYALIGTGYDPDTTRRLIAHELAHVSQLRYDTTELDPENPWFIESTAEWVAYQIIKSLNDTPNHDYDLLDPSVPREPGKQWPPLFKRLHIKLDQTNHRYSSWLFFFSGSIDLGDGLVKAIWNQASAPGVDGIYAVDAIMPLRDHFPRFTVRNWNRDLVPKQWLYHEHDKKFREHLKPHPVVDVEFVRPGEYDMDEPVAQLSARYYTFTFVDAIRKVTFRNLLIDNPYAHVWAMKEIGGVWKEPEDWTKETAKVLCRDIPEENLTKLVLVMSNSHTKDPLPPHPLPQLVADGVGCEIVHGWAKATLRVKDDIQDVTYASSRVNLRFKPWDSEFQDVEGNTQYDLMPTAVTWTANGVDVNGCRISGQFLVTIPQTERNKPPDPSRSAYGYLSVKGIGNSDSHGVTVAATDPEAYFDKTCPNDPMVRKHFWPGTFLLNSPWEANSYDGDKVIYKGKKEFDLGKTYDFMKLLPAGTQLPQIALDALAQTSTATGTHLYTWEWKLESATGSAQPGPPPPPRSPSPTFSPSR